MRPCLLTIQSVLLTIVLVLYEVHSFRWLGINSTLVDESNERDLRRYLCSSSPTANRNRLLDKEQKKICRRRTRFMKYVVTAAELARSECLRLAKYERWDCTGVLQAPKFSKDLRVGTRQAAFLHALSSAALVFAVTRSCAADKACDCGKQPSRSLLDRYAEAVERKNPGQPRKTYRYEGCHDNIHTGLKFSKDFLDRREKRLKKPASRKILNLHNYDLGRKIARESLSLDCKCHGMTASCPVQICTRYLPIEFSMISTRLFRLYKKALQVELSNAGEIWKELVIKRRRTTDDKKPRSDSMRKLRSGEMGYLYNSRNFCVPDNKNKLPGTTGRICGHRFPDTFGRLSPVDKTPVNVCTNLCCGRGHTTRTITISVTQCSCKWDDRIKDVRCKSCNTREEIRTCR
ncbi:protein Wnt-4-like isoform X1 [Dendronephthya gigantea]|uniref:protein Wnt-4-like isoform X1 n=1 Tax=Dendronephthya gigantea TaxID=151771 RepID=UPI001068F14F|nr:protein Wnt-4-like isoform X1 [Dendronephthya gigantea]